MRGAAVGWLASLFRIRSQLLLGNGVADGTARRVLSDQPDVSDAKIRELVVVFVGDLFSGPYMTARGFNEEQRTVHNEQVVEALMGIVARWSELVGWANGSGRIDSPLFDFAMLSNGVDTDLAVRLAAYVLRYGDRHPVLTLVPGWRGKLPVKEWWTTLATPDGSQPPLNSLARITKVARETVRATAKGRGPRAAVIDALADGLASMEVRVRPGGRKRTAPELTFELRVACAMDEVLPKLFSGESSVRWQNFVEACAFCYGFLPGYSASQIDDFLRFGVGAPTWPEVEAAFRLARVYKLKKFVERSQRESDARFAMSESDPKAAIRAQLAYLEAHVADLRQQDAEFGGDTVGARLAEAREGELRFFRWMLDPKGEPPVQRPELRNELRADMMAMEAIAPWQKHSREEQERILREAVTLSPTNAEVRRHLASHLAQDSEEGLALLQEAVRLKPDHADGLRQLAGHLAVFGRLDEALAVLDRVAAKDRATDEHRIMRAAILTEAKRHDEAERLLTSVIEEDGHNAPALRALAHVKDQTGAADRARELRKLADHYGGRGTTAALWRRYFGRAGSGG